MVKAVLVLAVILLLLIALLFGCHQCGEPNVLEGTHGDPISYNGTVYYFKATQEFGSQLSIWIQKHPELRVVSVAPLDTTAYGRTRGYWVVVEKITKE